MIANDKIGWISKCVVFLKTVCLFEIRLLVFVHLETFFLPCFRTFWFPVRFHVDLNELVEMQFIHLALIQ